MFLLLLLWFLSSSLSLSLLIIRFPCILYYSTYVLVKPHTLIHQYTSLSTLPSPLLSFPALHHKSKSTPKLAKPPFHPPTKIQFPSLQARLSLPPSLPTHLASYTAYKIYLPSFPHLSPIFPPSVIYSSILLHSYTPSLKMIDGQIERYTDIQINQ